MTVVSLEDHRRKRDQRRATASLVAFWALPLSFMIACAAISTAALEAFTIKPDVR